MASFFPQASKAKRLCPLLPGVANMKEYRQLSLLVHQDKAHCAAAFKLVRQVCEEALSSAGSDRDTSRRYLPPPPDVPRAAASSLLTAVPRAAAGDAAHVRHPILIYCPSSKNEFAGKVGRLEQMAGMKCARCPEWLSPPWQKKPPVRKEPTSVSGR